MSKILIKGNKVIIDGHANDLETCNTLTNLCDELSKSEKFRTIKYESGYGEFESVSENEDKKFVPSPGTVSFYIKSNDGSSTLFQGTYAGNNPIITTMGVSWYSNGQKQEYIYNGSKVFLGLSNTPNATVAKYTYGTVSLDEYDSVSDLSLYIVENIIIPDHHSSLTELFTNIAAVIREKTGDTASIIADDFPSVIRERLQKKPQTETWYFNTRLTKDNVEFTVYFTSNGKKFTSIRRNYSESPFIQDTVAYDGIIVVDNGDWNYKYQTIILDEPATGDLLTWLQINAVRQ